MVVELEVRAGELKHLVHQRAETPECTSDAGMLDFRYARKVRGGEGGALLRTSVLRSETPI